MSRIAALPFAAAVPLLFALSGCSWSWGYPDSRTIWSPSPDRPALRIPPSRPLQVWLGVPPAVWLTAPGPSDSWPEYEPMSKPSQTAIWVHEHWDWDWDGIDGFVWLRGTWIEPPGAGFEWNPPAWSARRARHLLRSRLLLRTARSDRVPPVRGGCGAAVVAHRVPAGPR